MDEAVPGITEIIPSEDSPTVAGSASDLPRMPADDAAAPVDTLPEITYDEQRYPARPRRLRPRDQLRRSNVRRVTIDPRTATATNPSYVEWLVRQAMLKDADVLSRQLSGQPSMWRNPYARPDARRAIHTADVWFTAYPDLAHHPAGRVVPRCARAGGPLGRVRARGHQRRAHGPGQACGRDRRMARDPERGWAFRPDLHADRPGVRRRRGLPTR